MPTHYFETSGLVKLYVTEPGSHWVTQIYDAKGPDSHPLHLIGSSNLSIVEVASTFGRLRRMNSINAVQRQMLIDRFARDQHSRFDWVRLDDEIVTSAAQFTQIHPLRAYDAVHLASALAFNRSLLAARLAPAVFVSADDALCEAARTQGLQVENPNSKP